MKKHRVLLPVAAILATAQMVSSADASSLKPPAGASVAIVMFQDLECPKCSGDYKAASEIAKANHVPLILKDFPLPFRIWAMDAAIYARLFDTKSVKLGKEFRAQVLKSQQTIHTAADLRTFTEKFAADHDMPLPFVPDPQNKLKALVQADLAQGKAMGVQSVPSIFVIGSGGPPTPSLEVTDTGKLSQAITQMRKQVSGAGAQKGTKSRQKRK